jgi:hypothetical protein
MTEACKHVERTTNLDGEVVETLYKSLWCPDCHLRIVREYKARPFKLRNR